MKIPIRKIAREALFLGVVALAVFGARSSLADHYIVPSGSMEPNLVPGDRVFVNKTSYGLRFPFLGWRLTSGASPQRGDVVILDSPESGVRLIKRIVAVAGDTVRVRGGRISIDGSRLSMPPEPNVELFGDHEVPLNLEYGGGPRYGPETIPAGHVLVMGDARGNSRDGRAFGPVPVESIYGRAHAVFRRRGEGFTWKPL